MNNEEGTTTFNNISYNDFIVACSEFFRMSGRAGAEGSMTMEQVENGHKSVGLLWIGRDMDWSEMELHQSLILVEMADKRLSEHEIHHALNGDM